MKNLAKQLQNEVLTRKNEKQNAINKVDFCEAAKLDWYLSELLPAGKKKHVFESPEQLKDYLAKRLETFIAKKQTNLLKQLEFNEFEPIENLVIAVEWKKSATWGANPTAEAKVKNLGLISSGSIGGCGYDKLSTAVARVLNSVPQFRKLMFEAKDKNINKSNHDIFGYGSGYGILPSFEGGVGVSCYYKIFEAIGYKFEQISSGKTFDVFQITKN